MRIIKTIMTGMFTTTLAITMACGISTAADASANVTFDQDKQTMAVNGSGSEIMVSFDAIKVVKGIPTWNANANWDSYDGQSATVDLSTLKLTGKNNTYVAVTDDSAMSTGSVPNVYCIPPTSSFKLTGKYSVVGNKGKLTFTENKVPVDSKVTLEYKTEGSNVWTTYNETTFPFSMYEQQGATIYFRRQATKFTVAGTSAAQPDQSHYILNNVTAGSFAGKESKVKITKMAKAPTAAINYDTGTITIKKGTEYRILNSNEGFLVPAVNNAKAGDFTPAESGKTTTITVDVEKNNILEIRTAATSKKVASKITHFTYTPVYAPGKDDFEKYINLIYDKNKVTFKNTGKKISYLFYTVDPTINTKAKPIVTLKNSDHPSYKNVTLSSSKLKDGTMLFVVKASNKAEKLFRSKASTLKIEYPKTNQ